MDNVLAIVLHRVALESSGTPVDVSDPEAKACELMMLRGSSGVERLCLLRNHEAEIYHHGQQAVCARLDQIKRWK
jgi:hypothetical protein